MKPLLRCVAGPKNKANPAFISPRLKIIEKPVEIQLTKIRIMALRHPCNLYVTGFGETRFKAVEHIDAAHMVGKKYQTTTLRLGC